MNSLFHRFAAKSADALGSGWAFILAILFIVIWAVSGPLFKFSDSWQLIINTGTTLITFLMVFIIENTQNRDAKAIHLKLDELIRAMEGARNNMVHIEALSDEELDVLQKQFERLSQHYAHVSPAEQVVVAAIVEEDKTIVNPEEANGKGELPPADDSADSPSI